MKLNIVFVFLLSIIMVSCKEKVVEKKVVLRPVRYGKVIKSGSANSQVFSGTAQSSKSSNLSFKVAGTINSLMVKVGDKVRKGQLIARIDAIDYSVQYDQAVAQLKSAETQIKSAETQLVTTKSAYERVEKLYENNSVPLSEYEQAKASYEAAQSQQTAALAQVTAAQKQVEAAGNQVSYARLTAPFSGIITNVMAEENELVGSGTPIATLNAERDPEVVVGMPETFIAQIKKGQHAHIVFSTIPDQFFEGTISEVSFSSNTGATYPVIVKIDNPTNAIRPGMVANVEFSFGKKTDQQAFLVAPVQAIGEGTSGNFAFVLNKGNNGYAVKKQNVEVGKLLATGFEVKNGLEEGDLVATAGLKSLLDGMEVKLLEE